MQKRITSNSKDLTASNYDSGIKDISNGSNYYLENALNLNNLPVVNLLNTEQVESRIDLYFDKCVKNSIKPTIPGLALSLGVSKNVIESIIDETETEKTLSMYFEGKSIPNSVRQAIIKAKTLMNVLIEDYMINGKINPVAGIFLAKNNFGYKDTQELVVAPQREETMSDDELINEAMNLPKK